MSPVGTTHHRATGHAPACRTAVGLAGRRPAAALLAAGGVAMIGTSVVAAWQTSANVTSGDVGAATAAVQLLDANGSHFTADLPDLLPGDWFYRYVDVRNSGSSDSTLTGTLTATGGLLGNLEAGADRCSVPWTTVSDVSTCTGTLSVVVAPQTVPAGGISVPLGSVRPGAAADVHLRYRLSLASAAPQSLMGAVSTVTLGVSGPVTGGRDRTAG